MRVRLKAVAEIHAGLSPLSEDVNTDGIGTPFLQGNAEFGRTSPEAEYWTTSPRRLSQAGDLLVSVRAPVGAVNLSDHRYALGRGVAAVRPRNIYPRFLWWVAGTIASQLQAASRGSTYDAVVGSDVENARIPLPDAEAQVRIADFLDRETHRIDALVDAKRRMIGLFAEKLEATIDILVAGPRNRSPEGWRATTLGRVCMSISDGPFGSSLATKHYTESGVRVIRLGNIEQGYFVSDDEAYISESHAADLHRYRLDSNDVVMAGLGDEHRSIGRACVIPQETLPAIHKADCYRIIPMPFLDPHYLASYLSSRTGAAQGHRLAQGTTRRRINTEIAAQFGVPVPPLEEQRAIMKKVMRKRHLIEAATSGLTRQLTFLAEYRQTLITQAVTGQLDEATLKGRRPADEAVGVIPV